MSEQFQTFNRKIVVTFAKVIAHFLVLKHALKKSGGETSFMVRNQV